MNHTRTLVRILTGLLVVCQTDALVHYFKMEAGAKEGCKGPGGDLKIDETAKDPKVCGVFACQNDKGDALIHYCQRPVGFAGCDGNGVKTTADWPDCCWLCVKEVNCAKKEHEATTEPI